MSKDINLWILEDDELIRRRLGKTNEEMSELGQVTNRILLQGIKETDPSTGELLMDQLLKEIGDVYAQLDETVQELKLDEKTIEDRRAHKRIKMKEWEQLIKDNNNNACHSVKGLKARVKELEEYRDYMRDNEHAKMLEFRGLDPLYHQICTKCNGSGVYMYSSTATWRGGIGGAAMTNAVCDVCWGSGDSGRPWTDLRTRK